MRLIMWTNDLGEFWANRLKEIIARAQEALDAWDTLELTAKD